MEIKGLQATIQKVKDRWKILRITSQPANAWGIKRCEEQFNNKIPEDFKLFYSIVNGMMELYPNNSDENGFLIYPLDKVRLFQDEFGVQNSQLQNVLIFADYMQKSWWYGVKCMMESKDYEILLLTSEYDHRAIYSTLQDFLEAYLLDADGLYP